MVKQYFSGSFVFINIKIKKRKLINQRLKKLNNSYNYLIEMELIM